MQTPVLTTKQDAESAARTSRRMTPVVSPTFSSTHPASFALRAAATTPAPASRTGLQARATRPAPGTGDFLPPPCTILPLRANAAGRMSPRRIRGRRAGKIAPLDNQDALSPRTRPHAPPRGGPLFFEFLFSLPRYSTFPAVRNGAPLRDPQNLSLLFHDY
jgi:hypothetical protein